MVVPVRADVLSGDETNILYIYDVYVGVVVPFEGPCVLTVSDVNIHGQIRLEIAYPEPYGYFESFGGVSHLLQPSGFYRSFESFIDANSWTFNSLVVPNWVDIESSMDVLSSTNFAFSGDIRDVPSHGFEAGFIKYPSVSILSVFSGVGSWLGGAVQNISTMFWTAESGMTVLGYLAVASLALAVILLIFFLIAGWLKFH